MGGELTEPENYYPSDTDDEHAPDCDCDMCDDWRNTQAGDRLQWEESLEWIDYDPE